MACRVRFRVPSCFQGCTFLGVCFAVYFFSTGFDFFAIAPGVSLSRVTGILLLAACLLDIRSAVFPRDPLFACALAMAPIALIPLLSMAVPTSGIGPCAGVLINVAVIVFAMSFSFTSADLRLCLGSLCAVGVVMALLMFVTPGEVGTEWVSDRIVVRLGAYQPDPNTFCGFFLFAIAVLSYRTIVCFRWWYLPIVGIMFYSILLTGSRGGLIAAMVALLAAAVFGMRKTHRKLRWVAIGLLLCLFLLAFMDALLATLPESVSSRFVNADLSGGTASFRIHAWGDVVSAYLSLPLHSQLFGAGYGSTASVTFNGLVAHNSYLETLYSMGFAGLSLYLAVVMRTATGLVKAGRIDVVAALLGFMALLMTLSDAFIKIFWAIIAFGVMVMYFRGDRVESEENR